MSETDSVNESEPLRSLVRGDRTYRSGSTWSGGDPATFGTRPRSASSMADHRSIPGRSSTSLSGPGRRAGSWCLPSRSAHAVAQCSSGAHRQRTDQVSYLDHRLTTEAQRQQFERARDRGDGCAACGRDIGDQETVYIEPFLDERTFARRVGRFSRSASVGIECASTEILEGAQGRVPERCAWCGRGVYYRLANPRRRRAVCSRWCARRASNTKLLRRRG